MKLRNKKTGEAGTPIVGYQELYVDTENGHTYHYESLQDMCKEWEDYEESRSHWSITQFGDVVDEVDGYMSETIDDMKQIGNYFSSREEAEKAVKKLKAWKFLKDECDIKFDGIIRDDKAMLKGVKLTYDRHEVTFERMRECMECLHLLFGDER